MKVICSWCEAEGKPAVVREKEPLNDPDETHGVCAEHMVKLGDPSNDVPVSGETGAG
jgi:hypothetical protein